MTNDKSRRPPNNYPILLRPNEAARALAISPRKLWTLTAIGEIPCIRSVRSVRYDPLDLRDWIEEHKSQGTSR